jgi:hypothetical protein
MTLPGNCLSPFWRKPIVRPVSVITGIICKDVIVMSADSQTTNVHFKTHNADKVRLLKLKHGHALIAQAGFADISNEALDVIEQRAARLDKDDYRALPELVQGVMREFKLQEVDGYRNMSITPDSIQDYLRDHRSFDLMVGYYHNGKPYLYSASFPLCNLSKTQTHFEVIGHPAAVTLSKYLLEEYSDKTMDEEFGMAMAAHVVIEIIKRVEGCGYPIKGALIKNPQRPPHYLSHLPSLNLLSYDPGYREFSSSEMERFIRAATSAERKTRQQRVSLIKKSLRSESRKWFKELMDSNEKLLGPRKDTKAKRDKALK